MDNGKEKSPKNLGLEILLWTTLDFVGPPVGGDEEDRTPDLRIANAALSQLSYVPVLLVQGRAV